ncbi:hypothetical protein MKZ38_002723 [Zalerion maritima]|uniref:Heterokaryon incompatibility domain-containing protein n=1 Tax=Zalerion maritima TaxID=339359 RepID=A0AAD5RPU5_9PEZI|nr:hypothetical protein MKZ38_002723 [Zalerion maritima]
MMANVICVPISPPFMEGKRRCLVCCDLDLRTNFPAYKTRTNCFAHLQEISRAILDGCPSCTFLWRVVVEMLECNPSQEGMAQANSGLAEPGFEIESCVEGGPLTLRWSDQFFVPSAPGLTDKKRRIELFMDVGKKCVYPSIGEGRHVNPALMPDRTLDRAKNWLVECIRGHGCGVQETQLPRRVLVFKFGDKGLETMLQEQNIGEHGLYVALLHGLTEGSLPARNGNHSSLSQWTPVSNLPKTIQDACKLTLELGLQRLWIDSLCAHPGDATDVPKVFQDSHLILAPDNERGFYGEQAGPNVTDKTFMAPSPGGGEIQVYARITHKRRDDSREMSHRVLHGQQTAMSGSTPEAMKWMTRNGVAPRRAIYPSLDEWAWECGKMKACECHVLPLKKD